MTRRRIFHMIAAALMPWRNTAAHVLPDGSAVLYKSLADEIDRQVHEYMEQTLRSNLLFCRAVNRDYEERHGG